MSKKSCPIGIAYTPYIELNKTSLTYGIRSRNVIYCFQSLTLKARVLKRPSQNTQHSMVELAFSWRDSNIFMYYVINLSKRKKTQLYFLYTSCNSVRKKFFIFSPDFFLTLIKVFSNDGKKKSLAKYLFSQRR